MGGTSSRTFYRKLWPEVKKGIRPGDYVIIELGHNDNGPFDSGRARATIRGISPTDSLVVTIKETGEKETVYRLRGIHAALRPRMQGTRSPSHPHVAHTP